MRNTAFAAIALASALAIASCGASAFSNASDTGPGTGATAPANAATTQPLTRQSYGGGTGAGGLGAQGTLQPEEASNGQLVVGTTLAIPNPTITPTATALQ